MSDRNLGTPRPPDKSPVADDLESMVRRSTRPGTPCWFRRIAPGSGAGHPLGPTQVGTGGPLEANAFPTLPLRTEWSAPHEQALVERWIDWAAPRLLCLPYLNKAMRARLEKAARRHAREVNALWRIYPKDVDPELIRTARVETRLRRAAEIA